jgi:type I restriction enzyme S subunit
MLENAAKIGSLVSLGSIIGDHGIKGGATPLGADYASEGVFFVRVQNVKPYRLDLSDAAYVDGEADEMLKRSRCVAGDIILGITGYPGTASLVMEDDLPVNINQHSVRFNTDGSLTPEYVTAAINSTFVQKQVDRLAIGGTRDALDYPSVRDLQIPVLDDAIAAEVTTSVNVANAAVRASSRLTTTAKCLVEALIEGKVSETDLVQAQEALERHDHGPDRALLARLTSRGMDVPDAAPLFPDLDKLYELLDQTDGDNPNGAAQGT